MPNFHVLKKMERTQYSRCALTLAYLYTNHHVVLMWVHLKSLSISKYHIFKPLMILFLFVKVIEMYLDFEIYRFEFTAIENILLEVILHVAVSGSDVKIPVIILVNNNFNPIACNM